MARKSRKNVGVIGLGLIGSRVAAGLRSAGFQSFVWNRSPKPAPNFVGSPAEVAEICEIIQLFVADAKAVREVIEALAERLTPKHLIINCATIGPEATVEIAEAVQSLGASFLDCPFTGSKGAAEKAQLVYYVGGDEEAFLRAKPVLEATSKAIVRCGRVGEAATLKVATNLITAVTTQTLAEALAIVQRAGIAPAALSAALEHNACKSPVVDLKLPKMIAGDYEPHFSVKHMFKDIQIGIHMANELKLEVPLTTVVGGVLYGALCNGWGDLDFASLYRVYSDAPKAGDLRALPATGEEGAGAGEAGESSAATLPPENGIETCEKGVETCENGTETSEAGIEASEKGVETSEKAVDASEKGIDTRENVVETRENESDRSDNELDRKNQESSSPSEESGLAEAAPKASTEKSGETTDEKSLSGEAKANGDEEDAGLGGFFSRVFRRRGTPAEK